VKNLGNDWGLKRGELLVFGWSFFAINGRLAIGILGATLDDWGEVRYTVSELSFGWWAEPTLLFDGACYEFDVESRGDYGNGIG
jgi:hypothetical protein